MSVPIRPTATESLHWRMLIADLELRQRWRDHCDGIVRREAARVAAGPPATAVIDPDSPAVPVVTP